MHSLRARVTSMCPRKLEWGVSCSAEALSLVASALGAPISDYDSEWELCRGLVHSVCFIEDGAAPWRCAA